MLAAFDLQEFEELFVPEEVSSELERLRAENAELRQFLEAKSKTHLRCTEQLPDVAAVERQVGAAEPEVEGAHEPEIEVTHGLQEKAASESFQVRAKSDPLSEWFPFKQNPVRKERLDQWDTWVGSTLCVGPPSSSASHWIEPNCPEEGGCYCFQPEAEPANVDLSDNVLVQNLIHKRTELLAALLPREQVAEGLGSAGRRLAELLALRFERETWEVIAFGVSTWLAVVFLFELKKLSLRAWNNCFRITMVGFPPPLELLGDKIPPGMSDEDVAFARTMPVLERHFMPIFPRSMHFEACREAFPMEKMRQWKVFKEDDDRIKNWVLCGLPGDQSCLRDPRHRHDAFWILIKQGVGVQPPAGKSNVRIYRQCCLEDGIPRRDGGLFDERGDPWLLELQGQDGMRPFQKHMPSGRQPCALSDVFCNGQRGVENGIDLRMFADMSTEACLPKAVGCRTVSLVRFGWQTGATISPAEAGSVHGGAISAAADEVTTETVKFWVQPLSSVRKINHHFVSPVMPYTTLRIDCTIEAIRNDGALVDVRASMRDSVGVVCISRAEICNLTKFGKGTETWW